jgi:hypothetical protein
MFLIIATLHQLRKKEEKSRMNRVQRTRVGWIGLKRRRVG